MQILYGPAPGFRLVQEVLLPILRALKIKPIPQADRQTGEQTDRQADRHTGRQTSKIRGTGEARGRLGQRGSLGESQAFITKAVIKLHNKAQLRHTASVQKHTFIQMQRDKQMPESSGHHFRRISISVSVPAPRDTCPLSSRTCGPAQFL